ncbi:MAG: DUF2798 domain-containing protein [Ruminococcus sp.]|nr:DUF2798 domain-containing protein [Ruminococcus sp.]
MKDMKNDHGLRKISFWMNLLMGLTMSLVLSFAGSMLSGHFTLKSYLVSVMISFIISLMIGTFLPMKPLSDKVCAKLGAAPRSAKERIISSLVLNTIYSPIMTVIMCFTMIYLSGVEIDRQAAELGLQAAELVSEQTELCSSADKAYDKYVSGTTQINIKKDELGALQDEYDQMEFDYQRALRREERSQKALTELEESIEKASPQDKPALEAGRAKAEADAQADHDAAQKLKDDVNQMKVRMIAVNATIYQLGEGLDKQLDISEKNKKAAEDMQGGIDELNAARNGMLMEKPSFLREIGRSLLVCYVIGFILIMIIQPLFLGLLLRAHHIKDER